MKYCATAARYSYRTKCAIIIKAPHGVQPPTPSRRARPRPRACHRQRQAAPRLARPHPARRLCSPPANPPRSPGSGRGSSPEGRRRGPKAPRPGAKRALRARPPHRLSQPAERGTKWPRPPSPSGAPPPRRRGPTHQRDAGRSVDALSRSTPLLPHRTAPRPLPPLPGPGPARSRAPRASGREAATLPLSSVRRCHLSRGAPCRPGCGARCWRRWVGGLLWAR